MNVVAPVGDANDARLRPSIALARPGRGGGAPDPTRCHFDAQDYMESATPGVKSTADGWMSRLAAALPGAATPTRALSIGLTMPRILSGRVAAVNLANGAAGTRANALDRPALGRAFEQLYAGNARFGRAYRDGQDAHHGVMEAASWPTACSRWGRAWRCWRGGSARCSRTPRSSSCPSSAAPRARTATAAPLPAGLRLLRA